MRKKKRRVSMVDQNQIRNNNNNNMIFSNMTMLKVEVVHKFNILLIRGCILSNIIKHNNI